jgi:adenylosuccinate lyase
MEDYVLNFLSVSSNLLLFSFTEGLTSARLPFMATESIIMKLVSQGISRQEAHEQVRVLSHQSSDIVKKQGLPNDLIQRIKSTEFFRPVWTEIDRMLDPKNFIGWCPEQVVRYCGDEDGEVKQALRPYKKYIEQAKAAELIV